MWVLTWTFTSFALVSSGCASDAVDGVRPTSNADDEWPLTSLEMSARATRISTLIRVAIRNALERRRVRSSRRATIPTTCRAEAGCRSPMPPAGRYSVDVLMPVLASLGARMRHKRAELADSLADTRSCVDSFGVAGHRVRLGRPRG